MVNWKHLPGIQPATSLPGTRRSSKKSEQHYWDTASIGQDTMIESRRS